jgi:predicted permease
VPPAPGLVDIVKDGKKIPATSRLGIRYRMIMETLWQDVKYALRTLAASPGFVAAAVLSLALGIGANTAIFTLTDAVFLNPLPVQEASRILEVYTVDHLTKTTTNLGRTGTSWRNFMDVRDQNQVFSGMAAYVFAGVSITGRGEPKPGSAQLVTANYFDVLGVKPILGRVFFPEEERNPTPVAILSYSLWQNQFGRDPKIIGQTVELNSTVYSIIGVAPAGFKGTLSVWNPDVFWLPISMHTLALDGLNESLFQNRRFRSTNIFGRLRSGVSERQALAKLQTVASQLEREYPKDNLGRTLDVSTLSESALGGIRNQAIRVTEALSVVVGLVLLIACVNLANLLLARSAKRAREIGIRSALGAGRARLIRQLLTESLVLALAGGTGGLLVGWLGSRLLWSFRPAGFGANSISLHMDARVFAFTAAAALFTGLLFGLVPAIQASAPDLNSILKSGGRGGTESWGGYRLRGLLVISQIALAMLALMGAGLFIRSMRKAEDVDPGFETKNLFVFRFDLASRHYTRQRGQEFLRRVLEQVQNTPGIAAAAIASSSPVFQGFLGTTFSEGHDDATKAGGILVGYNPISPAYFDTVRIPLREGRELNSFDRDGTRSVAVVSESMARLFWPGQDAIGRRFRSSTESTYREVVGVVADVANIGSGEPPLPIAYLPLEQSYQSTIVVVARPAADPSAAMKAVMANVQRLDPNLALVGASTMPETIARGLWAPRAGGALFGVFGLLGLALAALGIYGVMAYMVAQRTNEIGIRMALGAHPADVVRLVVGQGARLALAGIAFGVVAGLALSRLISGLLFGIGAQDPMTFCTVAAILGAVALLAAWLPALMAARIDPVLALRRE